MGSSVSSSIIRLSNFVASNSENLCFLALDSENRKAAQHVENCIRYGLKRPPGSYLTSHSCLNAKVTFHQLFVVHVLDSGNVAKSKTDQISLLLNLTF